MKSGIRSSLLLLLVCSGCDRGIELKGNIFVVTNGAQNLKLGLVEVVAIPDKEMNAFLGSKEATLSQQRLMLEVAFREAKTEYEKLKVDSESAESGYYVSYGRAKEAITKMKLADDRSALAAAKDDAESAAGTARRQAEYLVAKAQEAEWAKDRMEMAKSRLDTWPPAASYFEDLPSSGLRAISDADGNFSLKLPREGQYALAAHSTRMVIDKKEEYYWMIWITAGGQQPKPLMLSNNNLMTSDSPDLVVRTKVLTF